MKYVKVKNGIDTSDRTPPSGYKSWIDFWEKKKGKSHDVCEVLGCSNKDSIVGGHVVKLGESRPYYIVPLCNKCNSDENTSTFEVWESDLIKEEI